VPSPNSLLGYIWPVGLWSLCWDLLPSSPNVARWIAEADERAGALYAGLRWEHRPSMQFADIGARFRVCAPSAL
jgi:hypothetical protein